MTEEEKNEIYKEAFKCMLDNEKTSKDILSRFSLFETQYRHLNFQDYGNIRAFLDKEPTFQKLVRDTIDEKSKQNQIFENLKKAIEGEESIIEQIKALSRKRVVAVIGKNHELISGVFTYLWLTSPYCNNKPEGWLLPEIPIIRYFCSVIGEYMPNRIELLPLVLFIGLNVTEKKENLYKIQEFLERRSNQINNIRSIYIQMGIQGSVGRERMVLLKDTNCESEVLNILVRMVSDGIMPVKEFVISMDTLPAEFEDQFEPIYLEPEKQYIPASTPQDTTNVQGVTTFPLPPGAEVSDIEIAFLDEQTVRVYIKGQSKVFNFAEIGFLNRKTGKPNKLWLELSLYVDGNGITNQKDSERINTTLQSFFKTKQGLLKRTQTFFKIRRQTKSDNNKPTRGVFRECPVCKDRHKNYCSVCKVETEHCHECHDELYNHAKLNS